MCATAAETCEELFTPRAPHIDLALAGVEIVSNGSGSHHQLRKLDVRLDLIRNATAKVRFGMKYDSMYIALNAWRLSSMGKWLCVCCMLDLTRIAVER